MTNNLSASVAALSKSGTHTFNKFNTKSIKLLKGLGIEGDAHMGVTVKHRSRVAKDPDQPNLRQVHLIHSELHNELEAKGFKVNAGEMGENITTKGIDLLNLPTATILAIGPSAKIKVTGLRNPCSQLDSIQSGLMKAVLDKNENGSFEPLAGIMGIVLEGGEITVGDEITIQLPPEPYQKLTKV